MEEYLLHMKALRSQMNDVEEQAAKFSVDEQMQLTTIQFLLKDIDAAKSEAKQFNIDTEQLEKTKGQICSQILEKQTRIRTLDSDISTLMQTSALIQQERTALSSKLSDKRTYYNKVLEVMNAKLQEHQDWISCNTATKLEVKTEFKGKTEQTGRNRTLDLLDCMALSIFSFIPSMQRGCTINILTSRLDNARVRLDDILSVKSNLLDATSKMKRAIEDVKSRADAIKPDFMMMDLKTLEVEYNALVTDKAGETDYLQSLQSQIEKIKGVSHMVKCACGKKYNVAVAT